MVRALAAGLVLLSSAIANAQVTPREPPAPLVTRQPPANILCGTRVFRGDAEIDPKIVRVPRQSPDTSFTLRAQQPPVCRDTFATPSGPLTLRLPQIFGPKR